LVRFSGVSVIVPVPGVVTVAGVICPVKVAVQAKVVPATVELGRKFKGSPLQISSPRILGLSVITGTGVTTTDAIALVTPVALQVPRAITV
jgi:hypothetical protein